MPSRREHLLTLAELNKGLAATYALIAEELEALIDLDEIPIDPTPQPDDEDPQPAAQQRLGQWIAPLHLTVRRVQDRPDHPTPKNGIIYLLQDLFTTRDGSWEQSDKPGSIDGWAVPYLTKNFDDAGAATHLFAAVIGLDGQLVSGQHIVFWSDGIDKLADPNYQKYITQYSKERSGWCNLFIAPSSSYAPERGESGPWCWCPAGASDVVCGGGLPNRLHISTFAVWQAVKV